MISKKDLLKEKNISYGQLYRWKREGLIPDEWFIKQSVSTGQETYFKRDLIIPRINKILELKDSYQLEELKAFLNPDLTDCQFFNIVPESMDSMEPLLPRKPLIFLAASTINSLLSLIVPIVAGITSSATSVNEYPKDLATLLNHFADDSLFSFAISILTPFTYILFKCFYP
jgi:hypothetical protein